MKTFVILSIWLLYAWAAAFTFHLFPWDKYAMEWWYFPHVLTIIGAGIVTALIARHIDRM